jgi:hypothetical protein
MRKVELIYCLIIGNLYFSQKFKYSFKLEDIKAANGINNVIKMRGLINLSNENLVEIFTANLFIDF